MMLEEGEASTTLTLTLTLALTLVLYRALVLSFSHLPDQADDSDPHR